MRMRFQALPLSAILALCAVGHVAEGKVVSAIKGWDMAYPAGMIGGGTPVPKSFVSVPPAKEYYLDYQVWFESDWQWVKGGKLPGLVGGSHTSGCADIVPNGWSARFMWRGGGVGQVYLYHQDRKNACGDEFDFPGPALFAIGKWNRITERVVINAPGQADGLVEAWLNGKKMLSLPNLKLRGSVAADVALVDQVSLQTFYGGSSADWAPSVTTHARFSSFYVRDDLPDFSLGFDQGNVSGLVAAPFRPVVPYPGMRLDIFDAGGKSLRPGAIGSGILLLRPAVRPGARQP
jgi:hypothetical protein